MGRAMRQRIFRHMRTAKAQISLRIRGWYLMQAQINLNLCILRMFEIIFSITKTRLFKYIENFITKNWKFSDKNSDIFYIFALNIDCVTR